MAAARRFVGVIPAAGRATRLQPLVGSKETVRVAGRPVLAYLMERVRAVERAELRVVTRTEKQDVIAAARAGGADVIEADPPSLSASILAGMEGLAGDDVVLLGFPDSLWEPVDGFVRLVEKLDDAPVVLGLFDSPEPEQSDVVEVDEGCAIRRVHVKPAQPPGSVIWGCAAARARELAGLKEHDQPGLLFDALARRGNVRGVRFPGEFLDIGTPAGLRRVEERWAR